MEISGWGRYPRIQGEACFFEDPKQLKNCFASSKLFIPRGMGRSYGDSAIGDRVIQTKRFNRLISFNNKNGLLKCQSGVTLSEIIETFLPRGWFLAVVPGTKQITVGGAIASDVHGKNHHLAGCFTNFVNELSIMLPDGRIIECSRQKNPALFFATCGGMGLTGMVLTADLQLKPVCSAFIEEQTFRTCNLKETFDLFEIHQTAEYSVAWMDSFAGGARQGRSIFMIGRHANQGSLNFSKKTFFDMPIDAPGYLLNKYSMSLFNNVYYRLSGRSRTRIRHLNGFFFPLDAIENWNRFYGPSGLLQYQFVLPKASGLAGMAAILNFIRRSDQRSFLTVLKLFGPANQNYLSFPFKGYTLALDFPVRPLLFPLIEKLDQIVLEYGGRLYLAKDARMPQKMMEAGYSHLDKFLDIRHRFNLKNKIESRQSLRLGI